MAGQELELRKREELERALEQGEVHDPVSILIAAGVAAAVSAASYAITYAFRPKPPKQVVGKLSGTLQLQNSEQGIFIPEIYGAGPTAAIVTGSSPTYQNLTNVTAGAGGALTKTSGADGAYNAGASHNASVTSGDAFLAVTPGNGWAAAGFFNTASPTGSGGDATGCVFGVQWGPDGSLWGIVNEAGYTISTWTAGDVIRVELKDGRFNLYKNSALLSGFPNALAVAAYPLYLGVIAYTSGAGVSAAKVQIGSIGDSPNAGRGGIKVPAIIIWSSGIRKHVSVTQAPRQGGKGGGGGGQGAGTVENVTYDIDLGLMWCRGPVNLIREYANADILIDQYSFTANPSGVYDGTVGADPNYDPALPPDPQNHYITPFTRFDGDIPLDGFGVGSGTVQSGASAFAVYPGNDIQEPDPTIEADIDGKYGTGSTPAYRGRSLIVHSNFSLSRWSGIVPNMTGVWEHQTLKTLADIFGAWCDRVAIDSADYDFSGIPIACRGLLVNGRPFAPAELMDATEMKYAYNYFVTENNDGQIVGYEAGDEPTLTIDDTEVGWLDLDTELPDVAPEIESNLVAEMSLPREVVIKSIDPDNDWEPNTQNAIRQVTDGQSVELLEVQIAQLADERRATAQRALYQKYVGGATHKFTLPWTYMYLFPGYRIVLTRAEGFTHTLRLTSISGGVGVLDCEAEAIEPSVFTQPATGVFPPGYVPPQPIPAMTIMQLLDVPMLRDGDVTNNNGVGQYVGLLPRTGVNQNWTGAVLYVKRRNDWEVVGSSNLPATVGTVVSTASLSTDPTAIDTAGAITVDLYGAGVLQSVTDADVLAGKNQAVIGAMVFNFGIATQVAGYPNRWTLTRLLNGQRDTDDHIGDTFTGARFALVDEAIKFVPMLEADVGATLEYRAVSVGQSLADAATVTNVWNGNSLRPFKVDSVVITKDASNDFQITFEGNPRAFEEPETYNVEVWPTTARVDTGTIKRVLPVTAGSSHAALLRVRGGTFSGGKTSHANKNNVAAGVAATIETITRTNTRVDFGLHWAGANGAISGIPDSSRRPGVWLYHGAGNVFPVAGGWGNHPMFGITWAMGTNPGTVKEQFWRGADQIVGNHFGLGGDDPLPTLIYERDNVDPGYGAFKIQDTDAADAGYPGPRYSFQLAGSELRIYRNYNATMAQPPLLIFPAPEGGWPFPMYLAMGTTTNVWVRRVIFGASAKLATIYSKRDQIEDFGSAQNTVHFRIYQVAKYAGVSKGLPYDEDVTIA